MAQAVCLSLFLLLSIWNLCEVRLCGRCDSTTMHHNCDCIHNIAWPLSSFVFPFHSPGICVRCDSGAVHMHHKFAVVDGRRLITGSLNWTLTAIQSNKENILVTEEPDLVLPFITEFQRLWGVNDPARRHLPSIAEKPASLVL